MKQQGKDRSHRKERPEGDILLTPQNPGSDKPDTDEGTQKRSDHNGQQHRLPTEERTDHGHELDISPSHTFLSEDIGADPGQKPQNTSAQSNTEQGINKTDRENQRGTEQGPRRSPAA